MPTFPSLSLSLSRRRRLKTGIHLTTWEQQQPRFYQAKRNFIDIYFFRLLLLQIFREIQLFSERKIFCCLWSMASYLNVSPFGLHPNQLARNFVRFLECTNEWQQQQSYLKRRSLSGQIQII
jgi:hypothetical protein